MLPISSVWAHSRKSSRRLSRIRWRSHVHDYINVSRMPYSRMPTARHKHHHPRLCRISRPIVSTTECAMPSRRHGSWRDGVDSIAVWYQPCSRRRHHQLSLSLYMRRLSNSYMPNQFQRNRNLIEPIVRTRFISNSLHTAFNHPTLVTFTMPSHIHHLTLIFFFPFLRPLISFRSRSLPFSLVELFPKHFFPFHSFIPSFWDFLYGLPPTVQDIVRLNPDTLTTHEMQFLKTQTSAFEQMLKYKKGVKKSRISDCMDSSNNIGQRHQ